VLVVTSAALTASMQPPGRVPQRAALFAQYCASCHGPRLQGGSATSLVDEDWKHGGDDESIARVIASGVPGTPMAPFKGILNEQQIRELVFFIREQGVLAKGRPQTRPEPDGQVIHTKRQSVKIEVVARDLETPWGIAFLPDGRILATERAGRLRIIEKGRLLPPVSGIPQVWAVQDGGLLDVEVHPDVARNGWIYLAYSEGGLDKTSMTRIVRGKIRDHAWVEQQDIYKAPADLFYTGNIHYGVRFIFDRQGHLYYSIGDRGHSTDAQDLSKPTGKVHRVNDDGSVPRDNPFVGRAGALGSIWSYGHRHPQGFAFHPVTGKLWSSEHGPTGGDELNVIERGRNYGWPRVSFGLEPGVTKSQEEGMTPPVAYWNPSIAPAGMAFSGTTKYPGWRNDLVLAALGGQHLRRIAVDGEKVVEQEIVFNEFGRVRDVVLGPDGYLYVALSPPGQRMSDNTAGFVLRLVPVDPPKN
jgi:glucose/arabinose dehydrogenase